ncbi:MAG: hypothetical protein NWE98_09670 [Candidatus Bathyarchaeota archaeon]|nr:hypothetical protein [Candidatus Bathyarchaeota archaeon]
MTKRLFRSHKGVSTVISTILMIMVAMIGMSILFGYVVFYTNDYKANTGSRVLEQLVIEDVCVKDNKIYVWIYNAGTRENLGTDVNFKVSTLYVDGAWVANVGSDAGDNYETVKFDEKIVRAGQHVLFVGAWLSTPGEHYLKVVTVRGSSFEVLFTS